LHSPFAGLLPDETVLGLIAPGLAKLKGESFILDGFPRKASQAQLLDALLEHEGLNLVVELAVPDSVILSRIEGEPVGTCHCNTGGHQQADH
jgi:adenylate kinase family enzyme